MAPLIDFDGINTAALRDARSLLKELIPGGKFRSLEYVVRNPRRDDKTPGSFTINYRTGVWKDFATGDSGSDLISLVAYLRSVDQATAARELADMLGVPFLKSNGQTKPNALNSRSHNGVAAANEAPKVHQWGEDGPPRKDAEIRRHYYPRDGFPKRKAKIKRKSGPKDSWVTWYRVFSNGIPIGWRAKKPDDFVAIPYLTAALDPFDSELRADEVLWPEGEKDVDTLSSLNLPAFTFGGVGDGLPDGIGHYLKDRRLVIPADNDKPGREHAEKKASIAHEAGAASIRIIHFPELPPKEDVSYFIAKGGTAEQLQARIDRAPLWSPATEAAVVTLETAVGKTSELLSLATIKPEATDWLWHHRGAQTISTGWPGVGKSQQQCYIVARASTGTQWPDGSPCPCGDTIMLTCEDSYAKTVVPRLLAAGANLERVHALPIIRTDAQTKRAFLLTEDLDELERHLSALPNALLVTIDPITGFLGAGKINSNSVTDIRGTLAPLSDLAERRNVAIHTVTHPPKTTTSAMNAFIGSQAFVAASRMAYLTTEEMDEEGKPTGRFLMAMVRSSLGPKLPTLAYRLAQVAIGEDHRDGRTIVGSYAVWEDGTLDISANAALAAVSGGPKGSSDDRSAMAEAEQFLLEKLGDGPIAAKDGEEHATAIGISRRTLMRARKKLGVIAEKLDMKEGWTWRLARPEECQAKPKTAIKSTWHSSYPVGTLRGDGGIPNTSVGSPVAACEWALGLTTEINAAGEGTRKTSSPAEGATPESSASSRIEHTFVDKIDTSAAGLSRGNEMPLASSRSSKPTDDLSIPEFLRRTAEASRD